MRLKRQKRVYVITRSYPAQLVKLKYLYDLCLVMSETDIQLTLTLCDPTLNDEQLQEAVENLQKEFQEVEGVKAVDLIPIAQAPPNSKGVGGFLLGKLKALVNPADLKNAFNILGNSLFGKSIEIKVEGNGKKLELKINRPEDLDKIMPEIDKFLN
jgi:hypothetical protein